MNFSKKIISWYKINKRNLPWRHTRDAYKIWLSEIILQQTRIDQGMNYYLKFVQKYPNISQLASASEEEILKLWQGLGYYSRARNMHKTAKLISNNHNNIFPDNFEEIIQLKGIGEYTAAAILSFAYNKPYPVVDGNVKRLLSRLFGIKIPIDSNKGHKKVKDIASNLIDKKNPSEFNQAIMEFGALFCQPNNPDCNHCIFKDECYAFKNKEVANLPVKTNKIKQRKRYLHYLLINYNVKIYLNKRTTKDIWQNLYDFPCIEKKSPVARNKMLEEISQSLDLTTKQFFIKSISKDYKHILSHQIIHARFYCLEITNKIHFKAISKLDDNFSILDNIKEISNYPIPRLIEKYLTETYFI